MKGALIPHPETESGLLEAALRPIVFVGGKGGVGKTTVAAALALSLAARNPGRKVLLLSTDPAHSLADAFGMPRVPSHPNLEIRELDAARVFEAFRRRHREGLKKVALRGTFLSEEDLERFLDLGMPGLDELAALEVIAETAHAEDRDRLIVDTAPSGHTLRLLGLPEILDEWREALDSLMAKHRVMAKLYARGYVPDEGDALIEELARIAGGVRRTLSDPERTAFIPVMNPDPLSLWETERLLTRLNELGIRAPWIVLNKVCEPGGPCAACRNRHRKDAVWIAQARRRLRHRLVEVPYLPWEPRGAEALGALGDTLLGGAPSTAPPPPPVQPRAREAIVAEGLPRDARRRLDAASLCLVCGKGGVGKTTVACSLALHLAATGRSSRVLLFSTDPAHSLSDAFETRIGGEPREIAEGLDGVEIDPEARLAALQDSYREEIEEFFDSVCRPAILDLSLDREAMSRLIDLAPPGLDEIMALAELARHMRQARYAKFVIDTAPAGHFLRFLELPDLMRDWIRAFFDIFLKYKKLLRAPKFQTFLVDLSKSVRLVQELLADRERSLLVPVAIPTELSLEETKDLLGRTGALGLGAGFGILNRMTLKGEGCGPCAARMGDSRQFGERYRRAFPGVRFLSLEEQAECPTGVANLDRIGRTLFGKDESR